MNEVKRTERGWAGHFICSRDCGFRRNTLLEYGNRKWIISTVGAMRNRQTHEMEMIGYDRWYETMCFEAKLQDGYWDADVEKEIFFEDGEDLEWGIYGESWKEVMEKYKTPDETANEIHESIVSYMEGKIVDCE